VLLVWHPVEVSTMGNPLRYIDTPTLRGEQIAAGAIKRLRNNPRYPQRDLQKLSRAWFTIGSCFPVKDPIHAMPTPEGVSTILNFLECPKNAAGAAFSALRAAAVVCQQQAYDLLPTSLWEFPEVLESVGRCLKLADFQRLQAARLLSRFPHPQLAHNLQSVLGDSIFTVRWLSVAALASLHYPSEDLVEVILTSTPRDIWLPSGWPPSCREREHLQPYEFWKAVDLLDSDDAAHVLQALQHSISAKAPT
jgi:hypothetical protein